jgi:hypothetical protein
MFFHAELLNDPRRRGSTTNRNEEGDGRGECDDRLDMVCIHLVICLFFEVRLPVSADTPSLSFALLGMPLHRRMFVWHLLLFLNLRCIVLCKSYAEDSVMTMETRSTRLSEVEQ